MDAEEVTAEHWEEKARAMAAREGRAVELYQVCDTGEWTLRGRMNAAGVVSR